MTEPRLPNIGEYARGHGVLVEIQDVTPPPATVTDYIFEDTEATVEVRCNGKVLDTGSTFNNFYGRDSCVTSAIQQAKEMAEDLGESSLDIVVVKSTARFRMRPGREKNLYDPQFLDFASLAHGSRWGLPEVIKEEVFTTKTGKAAAQP